MTRHDMLSPRGVRFRDEFGLVTIEETAARYGIDRARIAEAVHVGKLASVTFPYERRRVLVLVATADGAGMAGRTAVAPTPANALRTVDGGRSIGADDGRSPNLRSARPRDTRVCIHIQRTAPHL